MSSIKIKAGINIAFKGRYNLKVLTSDGQIKQELSFDNLIVNDGLDLLGSVTPKQASDVAIVGDDDTEPAVTDTALGNQVAATSTVIDEVNNNNSGTGGQWILTNERAFEFSAGSIDGFIKEVGFKDTSTGKLFSRSLISDVDGNPTSLLVLSDETLVITYVLEVYVPNTLYQDSVTINSVSYNYTIQAIGVNISDSYNYWLPIAVMIGTLGYALESNEVVSSQTSYPGGTAVLRSSVNTGSYVSGTYKNTVTYTWVPAAANFATGIGNILFCSTYQASTSGFQCAFSTKLPKTDETVLAATFEISWSRLQ